MNQVGKFQIKAFLGLIWMKLPKIFGEDLIRDISSTYQLDGSCYSICPGNHDLKLSEKGYSMNEPVTVAEEDAKENYIDFYYNIKAHEPTESLFSIRRVFTEMLPVEIISVNSVLLKQGKHFMGMGYVGNDQLNNIEQELSRTNNMPVVRILVMHHHLLPVIFSEHPEESYIYSMMLDSEAISQFLVRNHIGLVLHGHTHKEYYAEVTRKAADDEKWRYYVVGMGSTGAAATDLSEGRRNMFSVLRFSREELTIKMYSLMPNGEKSELLFNHVIPLKELCPQKHMIDVR